MSDKRALRDSGMAIPDEFVEAVVRAEELCCSEITPGVSPREAILATLDAYDGLYTLVEPFLDRYPNARILEVGSGNGLALCYALKRGLDAIGLEPGTEPGFEGRFDRAVSLLEANGFTPSSKYLQAGYGEALPFADASFDIVASIAVLEHVQDVGKTIDEALRVLRPGGLLIVNVPNYDGVREAHYHIPWLPYLLHEKRRASAWVRLFGRSDAFVQHLNFTSPRMFRRLLRKRRDVASYEIHYQLMGALSRLSAVNYYLGLRLLTKHRLLAALGRRPLLAGVVRGATGATTRLLGAAGLAPAINVICRKSDRTEKN